MSQPEANSDPYPQPPVEPAQPAEAPQPAEVPQPVAAPQPVEPAPTAQFAAPAAAPAFPAPGPAVPMAPMAPPVSVLPSQGAYQPGQAPVSGPAYPVASGVPYPTSSMPTMGYPAYPPAPAPVKAAKPGRLPVILLSVLSGLLVLALIGVTTLFFVNVDNARKKQDSLTSQLSDRDQQLADTQKQLETKAADLTKLQQDLDGSKAATAEQTKQKEAVAKCLDLIYDVLAARTVSEFNKRLKAADKPCDEADKYVDSF